MNAFYKGQPIFGPRGPAGPDGNPIGTIISFLGLTAPKDYLICDGAAYNISDYPELAAFFQAQFGSADHFGGDGETTFAVPDMRNLFLRGYHGEAEEQLSGEIGAMQEGTSIPNIFTNWYSISSANGNKSDTVEVTNADSFSETARNRYALYAGDGDMMNAPLTYTARPVNMAVLFCIKAVESLPAENVYSTEETRIGTWIDGKPLYRKVYSGATPNASNTPIIKISDNILPTKIWGRADSTNLTYFPVPFIFDSDKYISLYVAAHSIYVDCASQYSRLPLTVVLEYTKTTD